MIPLTTVCVFAKAPVPGRVKTRLIPCLGQQGATELARALLRDTMRLVLDLRWARPVLALEGSSEAVDRDLLDGVAHVWPQGSGDLGKRQERALRRALELGDPVLLIGTDLPGLPAAHLEHAARMLTEGAEAVVGPAADGGFYLIGVTRCAVGLLDDLPWSCGDTRRRTIERLRRRGMETRLCDPWFDVDEPHDLPMLAEAVKAKRLDAPNVAAVVDKIMNKIK